MKIEHVHREVIENKLLTRLNDEKTVACLFERGDLDLIIKALQLFPIGFPIEEWRWKAKEMADDLTKLRKAALP